MIHRTVQTVAQVFSEFHIIARAASNFEAQFLHRYGAHLRLCPDAEKGMGHSLAFGVSQLAPECEALLVVLADMPWLQVATLQHLRDQLLRDLDVALPPSLLQHIKGSAAIQWALLACILPI